MKRSKFTSIFTVICMLFTIITYTPAFASSGTISGYVWYDANGNGKWESGNVHEFGMSGVNVNLRDTNNNIIRTVTNSNSGQYTFSGLSTASTSNYKVEVILPNSYDFTVRGSGNGNGVQDRLSKANPETGMTDELRPTNTEVNIGLKRVEGTVDTPKETTQQDLIDITRTINTQSIKQRDTFDANYTITPNTILVNNDSTRKDIVLVIDTSGSMDKEENGTKKIYTMKTVAKNFIDKFKNSESVSKNINIGIVEYSSYARKVSDIISVNEESGRKILKDKIDDLQIGGATNIGDGIRTAKAMLDNDTSAKEKYIILMTDGATTSYSKDKNSSKTLTRNILIGYPKYNNYYSDVNIYSKDYLGLNINTEINHVEAGKGDTYEDSSYITYNGNQSGIDTEALSYAKNVVINLIKGQNDIKQFILIGFGADANDSNEQIVDAAGGYYDSSNNYIKSGKYYSANGSDTLQNLYNGFADNIMSRVYGTIEFQETFSNNLEVQNANLLPYGLQVDGNKVVGKIDVEYSLNSDKTKFTAKPINLTIKYNAERYGEGKAILGNEPNSSFAEMTVSSYKEKKTLDKKVIEIRDETSPTPPSINANIEWTKNPVAVTITSGTDLDSGVNRTEYKLVNRDGLVIQDWTRYNGQFNVNNEGQTVLSARTVDNKGNVSSIAEKTIKIDMTPPASPTINWDLINKRVTIVPGTDPLSGVNRTQYCLVIGENTNENWIDYSMTFTLANANNTTIKAKSIDKAGNVSDITERELKSDRPEVKIKVRDASGLRDVYDVTSDNSMKRVDKTLDPEVRLQGEAYVDINLESEGTDDVFQYKIIQYIGQPSEINLSEITEWSVLDLQQQQQVNEDVVIDKQGYLNYRGYDVNHIQTGGNTAAWEDKENVYKNPSSSINYLSAKNATSKEQYGQWENSAPYTTINKDNKASTATRRWVTNTVFTNTVTVDSGYSIGYKEASKFWGYLKVNKDGYYVFGGSSDDGSVAYLTADGTSHKLFDMFTVQATKFTTTNKHLYLSKDKYYPIYLEYFNWGEAATFLIKYKYIGTTDNINTTVSNSNNIVPPTWFYPSKNITPGEYGTTIFSGSTGVKIPTDSGKYYIIYRAVKKATNGSISTVSREGTYGPFIVEQKAGFNLERVITDSELAVGSELEIKYTITPQPFDVYSVYTEGSENIPSTYTSTVSNFKYDDILPVGLTPIKKNENTVINGQKVNINLSDVVTYVRDGNIYKAEPINFSIHATINESKEFLLQGKEATLTYRDIDNAQRQLNFNDLSFVAKDLSSILKHGIFVKNNSGYIRDKEDINKGIPEDKKRNLTVVKEFTVTLAMIAEVNNPMDTINIKIHDNFKEERIVFKKYELLENGEINRGVSEETVTIPELKENNDINSSADEETVSLKNKAMELKNADSFKLSKGKKYLIVYTINPQGSKGDIIKIESYINSSAKDNVKSIELFIENLPTLK